MAQKKNPKLKQTKECLYCKKSFISYISQKRKYCSQSCSAKATYNHPYLSVPRGEKHYLWKGGISPERKRLYFSKEYKLWRTAVFERDNYTCVWCGVRGGKLNADHIKPWAWFPELRFAIDNGRTLCIPCHQKTDTYGGNSMRRLKRTIGAYPD